MKKSVQISDLARTIAAECWRKWPSMKPVGKERQQKDLEQLNAILNTVSVADLHIMILELRRDRYRRDWVATFSRIAEELPRIHAVLEGRVYPPIANDLIQQFRRNRD